MNKTIEEEILDCLDALGSNEDEIAQTLEKECCFGYPGSPSYCPIATLLHIKGFKYAKVLYSSIYKYGDETPGYSIPLQQKIRDFIEKFDKRLYPKLLINLSYRSWCSS